MKSHRFSIEINALDMENIVVLINVYKVDCAKQPQIQVSTYVEIREKGNKITSDCWHGIIPELTVIQLAEEVVRILGMMQIGVDKFRYICPIIYNFKNYSKLVRQKW